MARGTDRPIPDVPGATLTRRAFVKAGGALFVAVQVPAMFLPHSETVEAAETAATLDPTRLQSWLEVRADNTILARTGKTETGTAMSAFYAQLIAEELYVRPESVSLVLGHTDETPDGGYSAGFLGGAASLQEVAAHTRQALLQLASVRLAVPAAALSVTDGIISGGGKTVTYGQLVQGQQLDLTISIRGALPRIDTEHPIGIAGLAGISVAGNAPRKPIAQYTVVGRSHPSPGIPNIVTGKTSWSGNVDLPGLLHARMIRPATLGSSLVATGPLDRTRFPTAEIVTKGNFVAVVSPSEGEAMQAARAVAARTKWTDWSGLPGHEHVTRALRAHEWGAPIGTRGDAAKVDAALASAAKVITAAYEQPYVRHAPIGPYSAAANIAPDGTVTVWGQSSQPQGLRVHIAHMLGIPVGKVIVRWQEGAGQYGRTTNGGDGAHADAVILAQLLRKPVRVQWTLQEDLAWSTVSPAWVADVKAGLDSSGKLVALRSDFYHPHENDARMLGAVLAGLPTLAPKITAEYTPIWTVPVYDKIPGVLERAFSMPNLAAEASTGGLRGNIMRTPVQRQQNFAIEAIMNEAAAAASMDPIQFRIAHSSHDRLIEVVRATAAAAGWVPRPSPGPDARRTGSTPLKGRGIGTIVRAGAPWAGIAEIEVTPSTGAIRVTTFTIGVDVGKVINPRHLKSVMMGGVIQGLSEALKEEVTFDTRTVTSTDWRKYRILTMAETPEIRTVFTSHDDRGMAGGGEAANALGPSAVVAAFFDATGVWPRRIPLTPTYVRSLLHA